MGVGEGSENARYQDLEEGQSLVHNTNYGVAPAQSFAPFPVNNSSGSYFPSDKPSNDYDFNSGAKFQGSSAPAVDYSNAFGAGSGAAGGYTPEPAQNYGMSTFTAEAGITEKSVRNGFIRKVYGILSLQLTITLGGILVCLYVEPVKNYVLSNIWMFYSALFLPIFIIIPLMCFRNKFPLNLILLFIFTYTLGVVSASIDDSTVVLEAVILTASVFICLTVFVFQTKWDFSFLGAGLFACLWILIIGGFLQIIFPPGGSFRFLWGIFGAIVFSLYILYDTSELLHRHSTDEYVLATINLYLDVVNLFLYILTILGGRK